MEKEAERTEPPLVSRMKPSTKVWELTGGLHAGGSATDSCHFFSGSTQLSVSQTPVPWSRGSIEEVSFLSVRSHDSRG